MKPAFAQIVRGHFTLGHLKSPPVIVVRGILESFCLSVHLQTKTLITVTVSFELLRLAFHISHAFLVARLFGQYKFVLTLHP